jgi:plastocyanin
MHTLAVQLAPILAAEKSKVPFYIAGGLLVAWALIASLVLGRRGDFPSTIQGQRGVIAITVVLVLAAVSTAVLTAGPAAKATAAAGPTTPTQAAPVTPAPAVTAPATTAPAKTASTPTTTATAPETSLKIAADPSGGLAYTTKLLSAKAGRVTITMSNSSQLEHNLTIASGSTVLGATPTFAGGSKTISLLLKPGTYTFYCSVPGHRQSGMEGTLKVS